MAHDDKKEVQTDEESPGKANRVVPIVYDPTQPPAVYSDNALVSHTESEFILSFFQIEYPFPTAAGADDRTENSQPSDEPKHLTARCVSRVIMSPNQMIRVVNALQGNLAKFLKKVEEAQKGGEAEEES
jgi:hypothetical protein